MVKSHINLRQNLTEELKLDSKNTLYLYKLIS